ncbi:MAG: AAC(3) family N-acetyltransferase [Anaerolineae bacterium]|nr:AAC(3) family N-acetyltransferase [Anaerolineae bacterium]
MISFRDIERGLQDLKIPSQTPVIVHASLSAFGDVQGGAESVLGALARCYNAILMPTFTYKTMIIPSAGPENNGLVYGSGRQSNLMAEFYNPTMPADKMMWVVAEKLRNLPAAKRSSHPILSFSGIHMDAVLNKQSIYNPLGPIQELANQQGWVLLLGVDHTVNTSLHLAERLSGRKQFIRWALTPQGISECPNFPGCSDGFNAIAPYLGSITRQINIGNATVQALPLLPMLDVTLELLRKMPGALLCDIPGCERCYAVRQLLAQPLA